jgi:hypothetical protein
MSQTLDGRLGGRIDAAHAEQAGTVAVDIDDELLILDEQEAVTVALRIAAALSGGDDE